MTSKEYRSYAKIFSMENGFLLWLQTEIIKQGWNQSELARRAGLSRGTINNLLNEVRQPGPEVCEGLARAFSLPPEEVFRKAGLLSGKQGDDYANRLAYRIANLPEEDQEVIDAMIDGLYLKRGIKQNEDNRSTSSAAPRPKSA